MRAERDEYMQAADALPAPSTSWPQKTTNCADGPAGRASSPGHDRSLSYGRCRLLAEPASGWLDICSGVERPSTFAFRCQAKPDVTPMTRSLPTHLIELSDDINRATEAAVGRLGTHGPKSATGSASPAKQRSAQLKGHAHFWHPTGQAFGCFLVTGGPDLAEPDAVPIVVEPR